MKIKSTIPDILEGTQILFEQTIVVRLENDLLQDSTLHASISIEIWVKKYLRGTSSEKQASKVSYVKNINKYGKRLNVFNNMKKFTKIETIWQEKKYN